MSLKKLTTRLLQNDLDLRIESIVRALKGEASGPQPKSYVES